ncbi:MAG: hypothetical protein GY823_03070 [Flavobacteriaceae bacterium]|nr:hypothetical protein [Flavobacteriaceae bacterium]
METQEVNPVALSFASLFSGFTGVDRIYLKSYSIGFMKMALFITYIAYLYSNTAKTIDIGSVTNVPIKFQMLSFIGAVIIIIYIVDISLVSKSLLENNALLFGTQVIWKEENFLKRTQIFAVTAAFLVAIIIYLFNIN